MTQDDPWRAVRTPFRLPDNWSPAYGTCSRCSQDAIKNDGLWWHDGPSCQRYDAQFIPAQGGLVADRYTVEVTIEASGEVTPAPTAEADPEQADDEATPPDVDKELTDG